MNNFVRIGLKWVNLAKAMWIEDSGSEYKLFFEKSTILVVPKTSCEELVAYMLPVKIPDARPKVKVKA